MKDLRELLLIDSYVGGHIRDNDQGLPESQGAYVLSEDMETYLHLTFARRIVIPVMELHKQGACEALDEILWAVPGHRESIPGVSPGGLLDGLNKQLPVPVQKLYAKPGTPAWDRAMAEKGDLPLIEAIGQWGDWSLGGSVVLGLPHQENLGVSLQPGGGAQGLCIWSRFVAAARVVG